jgi:hypothetical protein
MPDHVHRTHDWQVEESRPTLPAFDEIDRRLIAEAPDNDDAVAVAKALDREARCSEAGEAILRILELIVPSGGITKSTPQTIGVRALCLLWAIGSSKHDIGNQSMAALAERTGTSRAIFSHWIRTYERQLGLHVRGQKTVTGSHSFMESSVRGWETRRKKKAQAAQSAHLRAVED